MPFVVYQGYRLKTWTNANGSAHSSYLTNTVESNGTLIANRQLNIVGVAGDGSSQLYTYEDSTGGCYGRHVASSKNVVSVSPIRAAPPYRHRLRRLDFRVS